MRQSFEAGWGVAARLLFAAWVVLHGMSASAWAATAEEGLVERRVKAAYLYRFAGYVDWPEGAFARPDAALVIGIWGSDDLAEDLARLVADRTIEGRRIEVRKVRDGEAASPVHMLFVGRERAARFPDGLAGFRPASTLVVTDSAAGLKPGAMINFVMTNGQIRFEVSVETADRHGLKLSSRLVAVAQNSSGTGR
ncbi:MAG TPA: YfiR family protein [Ramlibacter sp.]|nr:YfiR family protein [Ramlibacter sp.]